MHTYFEWDPSKAQRNLDKHGVSIRRAASVFRDPNALSKYDEEHSDEEDRWVTLGLDEGDVLLVVHHTFREEDEQKSTIRIISARKATKREKKQYQE